MDSLDQLSHRLGNVPWINSDNSYSISRAEMDGIVRWVKTVAAMVSYGGENESKHVLSSPARMFGHSPANSVKIELEAAKVPDAYARVIVKNAMEWADMVTQGQLPPGFPEDLFEPLLVLLERGCQFKLSKGFLEVGDKAIPLHRWPLLSVD